MAINLIFITWLDISYNQGTKLIIKTFFLFSIFGTLTSKNDCNLVKYTANFIMFANHLIL